MASEYESYRCRGQCGRRPQVVASEYEGHRCRVNAAEGRKLWRANMKAIAVDSMRPKAAGSGERNSVGVRSGSVRDNFAEMSCPLFDF